MIKSIKIEINGSEVDLSLEEAKKLYNDLGQIFSPPVVVPYINPYGSGTTWPLFPTYTY